jgi:hypothetical protein
MQIEREDLANRYELLRGSDARRGGVYLELWDRPSSALALWAFYFDADGSFEFARYRTDISAEVETWFQSEARRLLPHAELPDTHDLDHNRASG